MLRLEKKPSGKQNNDINSHNGHLKDPLQESIQTATQYQDNAANRKYDISFLKYLKLARPDHWFKNVFVLPGIFLALLVSRSPFGPNEIIKILYGLFIICLAASTNYVINEILDAKFDKLHPIKKNRPIPSGQVNIALAYVMWITLMAISSILAWTINKPFFIILILFIFQGIVYNVPPIRTKDLPLLDIISESVNNPIRLLLGWLLIYPTALPTLSLVLAYWAIGAFFMAAKRYGEYVLINNHTQATSYRTSFKHYSRNRLLISMFYFASLFSFFLGIFIVRYRVELILSIPFIALVIAYYLRMTLLPHSPVQTPESLYKQKYFVLVVSMCVLVICVLFLIDIPIIPRLFTPVASYYP